jgi:hypothetical protein
MSNIVICDLCGKEIAPKLKQKTVNEHVIVQATQGAIFTADFHNRCFPDLLRWLVQTKETAQIKDTTLGV